MNKNRDDQTDMKKQKKVLSKQVRAGGYSVATSLVAIALVVVFNLLIRGIPTTYTKIDTSLNNMFTISDQTKGIVGGLKEDVTCYVLSSEQDADTIVKEFIERYKNLSDHFKVVYMNPLTNPDFAAKYTSETVPTSSLILQTQRRYKVISYSELFHYEYTTDSTTGQDTVSDISFIGENQLTSAIRYVTSEVLPKMYSLTGHGEKEPNITFTNAIKTENIEEVSLNLVSQGKIPTDANCVMIYSPTSDISKNEANLLISYLDNGGKLVLITDYTDKAMPNLLSVAEAYGVTLQKGIVLEGDSGHYMSGLGNPLYLLPEIEEHTISSPLIEKNTKVLVPFAQGITILPSNRSTLKVTGILSTTDKSYSKLAGTNATKTEKETGDINGPFYVGVAVSEAYKDKESEFVWFSSSKMFDEDVNSYVSGGNLNLFLNALDWMCQNEDVISIRTVSVMRNYLSIPANAGTLISIVLIVVLPLCTLLAGVFVWIRRRKR